MGGMYTFDNSTASVANVIQEKVNDQLKFIDGLLVRNEYKFRIYADYFLGSLRFLFSVHDLNKTQLKSLDALSHRYLKNWLGLPHLSICTWNHDH